VPTEPTAIRAWAEGNGPSPVLDLRRELPAGSPEIVGIAFIFLAAPRLLPGHAVPVCELEDPGAIALGSAMEKSGAAELYSNAFLSLFQGAGPGLVMAGTLLLTIIVTEFLSNNAAAVLILPRSPSPAPPLSE
jgi:hypothetical protein